ncbi:MAG: DUF935 family protein [Pseudomonadota bacterium]
MNEDEIPDGPVLQEIAAARDTDEFILQWANAIREPHDPVLKGRGGDLKLYDHVRMDGQVWSTMQQRRDAVVSKPWEVEPGAEDGPSEEAAERLKEELEALDWNAITRRMHWGIFYGYGVAECMWGSENGRISFDGIRVRRARRFGFNIDGELMLRAVQGRREELMPDAKFWVMTTGSDTSDEPYGLGLAHLLYWPVYFKRQAIKSWLIALDKYASPTAKGVFPPGTPLEDQDKLLAVLRAIRQDSAFIVPEGVEVEYLQTSKAAGGDFKEIDGRLDAWISKVVLSQTMTTDDGASLSQSEVHENVADKVAISDAELLDGSFNNGPAEWWTWWNFGDRATPPKIKRIMEDQEDLDTTAERDEKLARAGWRRTQSSMDETYGEGYEFKPTMPTAMVPGAPGAGGTPGEVTNEAPDPEEMAEEEPDAVTAFVDSLISSGAAPTAAADLLAPIVDAADGAGSFEELRAAIDGIELSDDALEPLREHLAQAAFAARIGGEVGAALRDDVEVETP